MCTDFLVEEDIVATAAHFANEKNITNLRIVFGFKMTEKSTPITQLPGKNIYKAVKIISRDYKPRGNRTDWALVQLDRKVNGHR